MSATPRAALLLGYSSLLVAFPAQQIQRHDILDGLIRKYRNTA